MIFEVRGYRLAISSHWLARVLNALLLIAASAVEAGQEKSRLRDWTIEDSIAVRYISVSQELTDLRMPDAAGVTSLVVAPNREHLFFITQRGDLLKDAVIEELFVYSINDIRKSLVDRRRSVIPVAQVKVEGFSSKEPPIKNASWDPNGGGVLFVGETPSGVSQVKRLDLASGKVLQVTNAPRSVRVFRYRAGSVVFTQDSSSAEMAKSDRYPMAVLPLDSDGIPYVTRIPNSTEPFFYVSSGSGDSHGLSGYFDIFSTHIAPSGRKAISVRSLDSGPTPAFSLIDIQSGKVDGEVSFLLGSETGGADGKRVRLAQPMAIWSEDGVHVVLVNARLPNADSADDTGYILDYEVASRRWRVLDDMIGHGATAGAAVRYVTSVSESELGREFVVTHEGSASPTSRTYFHWKGGQWSRGSSHEIRGEELAANQADTVLTAKLCVRTLEGRCSEGSVDIAGCAGVRCKRLSQILDLNGAKVFLRQAANVPSNVIATDDRSELSLLPPDPALRDVWRAEVKEVAWQEFSKAESRGGLMLPRGISKEHPPPLVIQVYHYAPELFLPDGPYSAGAFAAQPLVSKGFAVLQISLVDAGKGITNEGPHIVERVDSAVEELQRRGLIDASRVGLMGFSRSGYQAFYTLTHPGRVRLAAVAAFDFFTGMYGSYLLEAAEGAGFEYERMPGGSFWNEKKNWLEYETSFNIDRVETPALFAIHGMDIWDSPHFMQIIGAFRLNRKPFEWLTFPEGYHTLVRPRERQAEMAAAVQWMEFWLLGRVPNDSERASRWNLLRAQQAQAQATRPREQ